MRVNIQQAICLLGVLVILLWGYACRQPKSYREMEQEFKTLYLSQQYEEALKIGQELRAAGRKIKPLLLNRIGVAAFQTQKATLALEYLNEGRSILEKASQMDTTLYIVILGNIREAHLLKEDRVKAIAVQRRIIEVRENMPIKDWAVLGKDYFTLAAYYWALQRFPEAVTAAEHGYTLYREHSISQGDDYALVALGAVNANLYNGTIKKADTIGQQVLELAIEKYGKGSVPYADALQIIIHINGTKKQYKRSAPLAKEVLAIYERHLGADHPKTKEARQWVSESQTLTGEPQL